MDVTNETNPASGGAEAPGTPAAALSSAEAAPSSDRCAICGAYAAIAFEGQAVCETCLAACGSCCAEREDPL